MKTRDTLFIIVGLILGFLLCYLFLCSKIEIPKSCQVILEQQALIKDGALDMDKLCTLFSNSQLIETNLSPEQAKSQFVKYKQQYNKDTFSYTLDRGLILNNFVSLLKDTSLVGIRVYPGLNPNNGNEMITVNLKNTSRGLQEDPQGIFSVPKDALINRLIIKRGPCPYWCDKSSQNVMNPE
jgi:hypothetical protein